MSAPAATAEAPPPVPGPGPGRVLVVGAGLVGASVGLGLRPRGTDVLLSDISPTVAAVAADLGAGRLAPGETGAGSGLLPALAGLQPDLVVVAAPPDVTAGLVLAALARYPGAVVTDVASTKAGVVAAVEAAAGAAGPRYVGGHPMAGRERSGPMAARGDLFVGRPWVLTPVAGTAPATLALVRATAARLGAQVVEMDATDHDDAVALVSHLPQVAASLVAARLVAAPAVQLALSGQGLRDVTRIAASDPMLWAQILAANAVPLAAQLRLLRDDVDGVLAALDGVAAPGPDSQASLGALARLVAEGNAGRAVVPGKHGDAPAVYATVGVLVPDRKGSLAALIGTIDEVGVSVEDLRIEHSPGRLTGVAEVAVLPAERDRLVTELRSRGWSVPD